MVQTTDILWFQQATTVAAKPHLDDEINDTARNIPIDRRKQIVNMRAVESQRMLVIDPAILVAIAALISSLSAFVWSVRRKP